jgi:hypothetical protein
LEIAPLEAKLFSMATHIIPAVPSDLRELEIKRIELETLEVELTQG